MLSCCAVSYMFLHASQQDYRYTVGLYSYNKNYTQININRMNTYIHLFQYYTVVYFMTPPSISATLILVQKKETTNNVGSLLRADHKSDIILQQLNLISRNTMNHGRLHIWDRCQHLHLLFINGLAAIHDVLLLHYNN